MQLDDLWDLAGLFDEPQRSNIREKIELRGQIQCTQQT